MIAIPQDQHEDNVTVICYGQLEKIMVCELPVNPFLGDLSRTTWLLALLTPCNTQGWDAIREHTDQ